jgi:hypothetical protein
LAIRNWCKAQMPSASPLNMSYARGKCVAIRVEFGRLEFISLA